MTRLPDRHRPVSGGRPWFRWLAVAALSATLGACGSQPAATTPEPPTAPLALRAKPPPMG